MFHGVLSTRKRDKSAESNLAWRAEEYKQREMDLQMTLEKHDNIKADLSDYNLDHEIPIEIKPVVKLPPSIYIINILIDVYMGVPPKGEYDGKRFVPFTSIETIEEDENILEHFSKPTSAYTRTVPLPPINFRPSTSAMVMKKEDENLSKLFEDIPEYQEIKKERSEGIKPLYKEEKMPPSDLLVHEYNRSSNRLFSATGQRSTEKLSFL